MPDSTIALRVQQYGAEQVRNRLREIHNELKAGTPVTKNLKKEVSELGSSLTTQNRVVRLNEQAWLANHRTLQTSARIMSTLGSVARSALAVTTAWSIASLAFGKTSSSLVEAEAELARAQRDLKAALESGDLEKISDAQDAVNALNAKVKELKDQDFQGMAAGIVNTATSIALMGSSAIQAAPRIAAAIPAFRAMSFAFLGLNLSMGLIGIIATAVALAAILIIENWEPLSKFFNDLGIQLASFGLTYVYPFVATVVSAFEYRGETLGAIWTVVKIGFLGFWNGMIGVVNAGVGAIVKGVEGMVNLFVEGINVLIRAYNAAASIIGQKPLATLGKVAFSAPQIPTIAAATGFNGMVNKPTMFLAGEAGPERVSITPSRGNSVGGGNTFVVHVHGNILTQQEVAEYTLNELKGRLRQIGYTGF